MGFDTRHQSRESPPDETTVSNRQASLRLRRRRRSEHVTGSLPHSVNDQSEERQRYLRIIIQPRLWAVWNQPWRMTAYAIAWEVIAVAGTVLMVVSSPGPTAVDWFRCGLLGLCATIHIQLSRRQEERRRSRQSTVHIELTAIWFFPAVLVLPVHLVLLVILVARVQRWFTARRPLNRFIF